MNKYFIVVLTLSFALSIAYAQPIPSANISNRSQVWMTQAWTGNDKPYQAIEAHIEQHLSKGEQAAALATEYKAQAYVHPTDPTAQFAWAYATHKDYIAHHIFVLPNVLTALAMANPKNIYRYTRLEFLLCREADPNRSHPELEALGRRLLIRDSQDDTVRASLVFDLENDQSSLPKALAIASVWVSHAPQSPRARTTLASVYDAMWDFSRPRNYTYANLAVAQYKQFLRLAPPDDPYRKQVGNLLEYYQIKFARRDGTYR